MPCCLDCGRDADVDGTRVRREDCGRPLGSAEAGRKLASFSTVGCLDLPDALCCGETDLDTGLELALELGLSGDCLSR